MTWAVIAITTLHLALTETETETETETDDPTLRQTNATTNTVRVTVPVVPDEMKVTRQLMNTFTPPLEGKE